MVTSPARYRPGPLLALLLAWVLLSTTQPPAHAAPAAVASAHPLATAAGEAVLAQGGNAFDAAVAVSAALAVVEPYASGLGGGGFFLLHRASDGLELMVDARETAPMAARPERFRAADGSLDPKASLLGGRAAAIPGLPAGLDHLARRYGRLPLATSLGPALRLAHEGFPVDARLLSAITFRQELLRADATLAARFLIDGRVPELGARLHQPELAATLEALAATGAPSFYQGPRAQRMIDAVRAAGGWWEAADLSSYAVREREAQHFTYHGASITCASLPSAGGLSLAQALQILERFPVASLAPAERAHRVIEALRRAYQDRARYLGDPDFVQPPAWLARADYAQQRAASVDLARATPSAQLDAAPTFHEGDNTTHLSVVDAQGNRVAATLSVNFPFGAVLLAGDTGVLLNNEMDDFSLDPTARNAYGLAGSVANLVGPGRRPLSSMTPAFVEDARGVLVLGTPGGSRIISMVLLGILDFVDGGKDGLERVVSAPRFHHQFLPDRVEYEPEGFGPEWVRALEAKGHVVQVGRRRWGNMQAVFWDRATGEAQAYSDPRGKAGLLF